VLVAYAEIDYTKVHRLRHWAYSHAFSSSSSSSQGSGSASVASLAAAAPSASSSASTGRASAASSRAWVGRGTQAAVTVADPKYRKLFSQLQDRCFCDLICGLLSIDLQGGDSLKWGPVAYIWDGTDLQDGVTLQRPLLTNTVQTVWLSAVTSAAATQANLTADEDHSDKDNATISTPLYPPLIGSILPLSFDISAAQSFRLQQECRTASSFSSPSSVAAVTAAAAAAAAVSTTSNTRSEQCMTWIRLRNIAVEYDAEGSMYLKFHQKSRIYYLSANDSDVVELNRRYDARKYTAASSPSDPSEHSGTDSGSGSSAAGSGETMHEWSGFAS
jgi:hypothetical protein